MMQVLPYGFCFRCNSAYENRATDHWLDVHGGKLPPDPLPEGHLFTPEYLAWKREHESQPQKDLRSVIAMLEGDTSREKIVEFIRMYLLEEIPPYAL